MKKVLLNHSAVIVPQTQFKRQPVGGPLYLNTQRTLQLTCSRRLILKDYSTVPFGYQDFDEDDLLEI